MNTKLMPGAAARLQQLGIARNRVGRFCNKANLIAPKDIPIPANGDELAEMLADDDRVKALVAQGRDGLGGFIQAYANKHQAEGTELHQAVETQVQRVWAQMLKDRQVEGMDGSTIKRLNLDPQTRSSNMLTSHKQATAYNPKAIGAKVDNEFSNAAEFFYGAWCLNPSDEIRAKMARMRNAYSSVVPADGGFLVPETLRSQLLQLALEQSLMRSRATVVPMETARVPFPTIDSTTNAASVFGGMIAYWGEESAALTESAAKFGKVVLDAKKLTGFSLVPNELLSDSLISFSALIEVLWPKTLNFYEDIAYIKGTGVGEPLGFLGCDASVAVEKETSQSAATILLENVIKMYSRMLPSSLTQAVWMCTPEALPQILTMALSVGTGGSPVMLGNIAGPAPATIFGRPLLVTEKLQRLGTRGDLVFCDPSYYLIGDRQMMTAASSTDYRFANDQTAYRIIQRVDGRPWIQSAMTPQYGGPTLSPFVELATRS